MSTGGPFYLQKADTRPQHPRMNKTPQDVTGVQRSTVHSAFAPR